MSLSVKRKKKIIKMKVTMATQQFRNQSSFKYQTLPDLVFFVTVHVFWISYRHHHTETSQTPETPHSVFPKSVLNGLGT